MKSTRKTKNFRLVSDGVVHRSRTITRTKYQPCMRSLRVNPQTRKQNIAKKMSPSHQGLNGSGKSKNSSHHASLSGKRFGPSPTFCTEPNLPYGSPHGYRSSSQSSPSPSCARPFSRDFSARPHAQHCFSFSLQDSTKL